MMSLNREQPQVASYNVLKWIIIISLFVLGLAANYYYNAQPWPVRLLGWLALMAILVGIAYQTTEGKKAWHFLQESRMELRKVYWPTRQETIQTTLVVAAMVVFLSLVLWGVDSILVWLIGWLTGQRG